MKIWTTKDGRRIPYNQLSIKHILNIINYAKRNGFTAKRVSNSIVDNCDNVIVTYDCTREVIREMYNELSKRGNKKCSCHS